MLRQETLLMQSSGRRWVLLLLVCLLLAALPAFAQSWPDRPIRLVVNSAAGGALDATARNLADKLSTKLGQQVVVDNRPGAGGVLGAALVAKAPPDGYTLLFVSAGYSTLPALHPNLPFTHADFTPVAVAVSVPFVFITPPGAPYKTLLELIAYGKSHPGKLSFASGGNATAGHLLGTWFNSEAGLDMVHIAYKGESPAVQDLLGSQVPLMPLTITLALPLIKAGKVNALAISGERRSPLLPDVPTIAEQGVPVKSVTWFGMLAPAAVPKSIVARLNAAVNESLQDPELRDKYTKSGMEVGGGSPAEFQKVIDQEATHWGRLIRAAGIRGE